MTRNELSDVVFLERPVIDWVEYERRKAAWLRANAGATQEQFAAFIRELIAELSL